LADCARASSEREPDFTGGAAQIDEVIEAMARRFWLLKSDPATFGLGHLERSPHQTAVWDGVRNYQARNLLRDEVRRGDGVLFYHSQAAPPAVVALCEVVRDGYPEPAQFDRRSPYFDPRSTAETPRWFAVDIRLVSKLEREVTLPELRATPGLEQLPLLRTGNRLSVQPVGRAEWRLIERLGRGAPRDRRRGLANAIPEN
jgi:predicted RNA-binding protein with PUA-like domain